MDGSDMDYGAYCGVDVGKASHYAVALGRDGTRLLGGPVAQREPDIREPLGEAAGYGRVLVTVDQRGGFGALAVAVARDMGMDVACLEPKGFGRASATYGEGKSDARDAFVIADVSLSAPRLVGLVPGPDGALEEVRALCSYRRAVVGERTRCYNRLRELLHRACPPLEALFPGERPHNAMSLLLLARYGGPRGLRRAGRARAERWAAGVARQRNREPALVAEAFAAAASVTVALPGAEIAEDLARKAARRAMELEAEARELDAAIGERARLLPGFDVLLSVPGIGPVYAAAIAAETGDVARFPDAGRLASYGGVAPVREESGTGARRSRKRRGGNRRLKDALVGSARAAALHDPPSKAYYARKRAEGKSHKQALRALARRRVDLIYALLTAGALYAPPPDGA
ncbi:IS110 family transposase [Raoultibacter phocaeensis]|uniref:IS110 family transposase n=1 Tax=Raoultibacter phocaeensis TaxID=2479841 RepID=UPI0011180D49|nr:IS110 family transposase [Raoultibacter phocaeensis]